MRTTSLFTTTVLMALAFTGCKKEEAETPAPSPTTPTVYDPATAQRIVVDRFAAGTGTLMVRDGSNGLPAANAPINFDAAPFITRGFGPQGQAVEYYNFDVQPTAAIPIFVCFKPGQSSPVSGQLNIIGKIPGDVGYNDFWEVVKVNVPESYVANTLASQSDVFNSGYALDYTGMIVNCPVVPEGSTATKRLNGASSSLVQCWYERKVGFYFDFQEAPLNEVANAVPTSPIYVLFNINPDQPNGGPPSGFVTEPGTDQTHNVLATVPGQAGYSPLWRVSVINNSSFAQVSDLASAQSANIMAMNVMNVNCPVVAFP
ncbi:MAG: hypothetical protein JNL52_04225 [Flavobacteriales bacterium]|nr:hypothetical protein [Flavobacteriales bacterium]